MARGYAALVFDGPGQNSMLWLHGVPWRHDWEKVITPVVDLLAARADVDPARIALSGLSQGGYWVPRALAFEHRIAAGICDPGVMDVFTIMSKSLPPEMLPLLDAGAKDDFDKYFAMGMQAAPPAALQEVKWRMKPYGTTSYFEWYTAARAFNLRDVAGQIECPVFIADPDDEQFWPGQSKELAEQAHLPGDADALQARGGRRLALRAQGPQPLRPAHVRVARERDAAWVSPCSPRHARRLWQASTAIPVDVRLPHRALGCLDPHQNR